MIAITNYFQIKNDLSCLSDISKLKVSKIKNAGRN